MSFEKWTPEEIRELMGSRGIFVVATGKHILAAQAEIDRLKQEVDAELQRRFEGNRIASIEYQEEVVGYQHQIAELKSELASLKSSQTQGGAVEKAAQIGFVEGIHLAALYFETARSVIDMNAGYTKRLRTPAEIEIYADKMKVELSKDWEKHADRILALASLPPQQEEKP